MPPPNPGPQGPGFFYARTTPWHMGMAGVCCSDSKRCKRCKRCRRWGAGARAPGRMNRIALRCVLCALCVFICPLQAALCWCDALARVTPAPVAAPRAAHPAGYTRRLRCRSRIGCNVRPVGCVRFRRRGPLAPLPIQGLAVAPRDSLVLVRFVPMPSVAKASGHPLRSCGPVGALCKPKPCRCLCALHSL